MEQGGLKLSIPQGVLVLEIVANMLRLAFALDPLYCRWVYGFEAGSLLVTASIPFGLSSTVLVLVMFQNLLAESGLPRPFRMGAHSKVAVAVATTFLVALDLSLGIARSYFDFTSYLASHSLCYV